MAIQSLSTTKEVSWKLPKSQDHLFVCLNAPANIKTRLFIFPYVGAKDVSFYSWKFSNTEIWYYNYPEKFGTKKETIDGIEKEILEISRTGGRYPVMLYGHSLGALFAYEMALKLGRACTKLIVSGMLSSTELANSHGSMKLSQLSDNLLMKKIGDINNLDGEEAGLLIDPHLLQIAREQFRAFEEFEWDENGRLSCPILVFGGKDDKLIPSDALKQWKNYTLNEFELYVLPGEHMFIHSQRKRMFDIIEMQLEKVKENSVEFNSKLVEEIW